MKYVIYIIGICVITLSCKKDKLEGTKSIFIGSWEWVYTEHNYGWCEGDDFNETLTPVSENANYSITFLEKGIAQYFKNDSRIEKDRVVFTQFNGDTCNYMNGYLSFVIDFDSKEIAAKSFEGCISEDTLIVIRGYPFENYKNGCEIYVSYFVKK